MGELPTGTVTFLFTDLEGSTRLWEEHPEAMRAALARHDELLTEAVEVHGGTRIKGTGDGLHAVFPSAEAGVAAAVDAQLALGAEEWGPTGSLRVRMGLHTGVAEQRDGDYFGPVLNRAARLMTAGHGGQVLCSQATADLVRDSAPDPMELVDLGSHELRDLGRPEQVFQVTHPGLERDFAPLKTLDVLPSNLPSQRTDFIGRDNEMEKLAKLMDRSRVVTLTGVGGVGKTRLAVEAAASMTPRFDDGVWFVDLGPLDDGSLVPAAVAAAMRLPDRRQGPAEDAIVASARDARSLIIVDNCEHVIVAAASLAELIADRCPGVAILATSREALGIERERTLAVGPLGLPDADNASAPEDVLDSDAVRLFCERASAAREDFELTDDNAGTVANVCRRVDGIPLAIELAAARTQSMTPQSILERLDERFRLLSRGRRTALARHQTLRAAVDWSYDLLGPAEQLAFARLSVFAGGFTLEGAEAVVADDDGDRLEVVDLLSGLVAKSMVLLDEHAATVPYRVLDTLREYAADRLDELDDPDRIADRHARYYVHLAEQSAPHIVGAEDSIWSRRLQAEHDNLHAALTWARDHDPASLTRLAKALAQFWHRQRNVREGLGWTATALDLDPDMSPHVRAEIAAMAGFIAINLSRVQQGEDFLWQSMEASTSVGDDPSPYALLAFATGALVTNRSADARRYAEEGLARARSARQPYTEADCMSMCSVMITLTSDNPRGLELADQAIEMARPLGNDYCLGTALQAGGLARYRTDPAAALALLDESLIVSADAAIAIRDQALFFKGIAHASLREYGHAAEAFDAALALHHAAGAEYFQTMVLAAVAGLLARLGSISAALQLLGGVARLREDGRIVGSPRDLAMQEQLSNRLRQTLEPEEFSDLWAAGHRLTLDDAVSLARGELRRVPSD